MIFRCISRFTLLFCITLSFYGNAHNKDVNQAQLYLLEQGSYQLVISVDVLHLIKNYQKFSGDDQLLINNLQQLSLIETKKLLAKIEQSLSNNSVVLFEDKGLLAQELPIEGFSGLTVAELRNKLHPSATNKKIDISVSGNLPDKVTKIGLKFSPLLGDVYLTVSSPLHTMVMVDNNSDYFLLNRNNAITRDLSSFEHKLLNIVEYVYQGFIHILPQGLDHILFVLALFLLATRTSTLLWQVSAFTLAHTITLALGIFGVINLPSSLVEPLIALSIAYVAIENIYQQKLSKWRLPVIFAFGLLHGLGFASVLVELGLPKSSYVTSLLSFNVGVEFGQVTIIALALLATKWCSSKSWYRKVVVIPLSLGISAIALYWFVERII
jgi:hydrogenase/urease accessory protein HupE